MSKFSCGVRIEFDAAHRVIGHYNKCQYLHGHRYILHIQACSKQLNDLGMVVDFGFLKSEVKKWIDDNFDHTVILSILDEALGLAISEITKQKIYYLPFNPTAENIAYYLKSKILPQIVQSNDFYINAVKLYETPNCYALV